MFTTPLLTVAIPEYERPETLEKIILQLKDQDDGSFLVLISDDSHSHNSEEMIRKHQKTMPNLAYHRNEVNLGFSENVCKLYELATTRYIWFLCNDETVLPGAIKNIIQAMQKYEPVVGVFNCTWINPYGETLLARVAKDIIYDDIQELKDYQPLMRTTFLSILVVEKRIPIEAIKKTNYKDNVFVQVTLALLLLSDKFKFCEIASPIVHRNVGYKYGEFFKFYLLDNLKAVFIIKHKFENEKFLRWSRRHVFIGLKLYLSQKIGLFKYNGTPTKETIKNLIKFYRLYSVVLLFFPVIYFITPKFLIKRLYLLKLMRIHGREQALEIYRENIGRAFADTRKTGFTSYR